MNKVLELIEEATGHKSAIDFYLFIRTTGKHTHENVKITIPEKEVKMLGKWVKVSGRSVVIHMPDVIGCALEEIIDSLPSKHDMGKVFRTIGHHHSIPSWMEDEAKQILNQIPTI